MWGRERRQAFWDTSAGQQILTLDFILRKISDAQHSFINQAAHRGIKLACPPDCGFCCHGFMPDVLPVEADYIAYFLQSGEYRSESAPLSSPSPCPFHDPSRPGANCRIYEARPLICRLFGYSSTKSKSGETIFRLCRHMPTPCGLNARILDHATLIRVIGAEPPLMSDFAMEVLAIDPTSASERKPLSEALPPALARIGAILRYCPEEPEPNAA